MHLQTKKGDVAIPSIVLTITVEARSLPDLGNRSENSAGRGQILSILQVNRYSIDQENGKIWSVQTDLQQISPKSDRLLNFLLYLSDGLADKNFGKIRNYFPNYSLNNFF